jgi:hypothetical protein
MSDWIYRSMMTILAIMLIGQIVLIALEPVPVIGCVNGYIMEQHNDMWVQRGILPQHCILIDRD